jgi:hypothetical protein
MICRFIKYSVFLILILGSSSLFAQNAAILSSRFQLSGILNGERVAWESNVAEIHLNKTTGDFKAYIAIDDLNLFEESEEFEGGSEKAQNKFITFSCNLPVAKVIENRNQPLVLNTELSIDYNNLKLPMGFSFTVLALPKQGFSITGQGSFNHSNLEVEGLQNFDDDIFITWSIIGK